MGHSVEVLERRYAHEIREYPGQKDRRREGGGACARGGILVPRS